MYLGNVSKTSSAKHCVKLFSANLQTAVDWQECLHCFPQNMDSYVMRIIYQNSVVKVAMHFLSYTISSGNTQEAFCVPILEIIATMAISGLFFVTSLWRK